ncbi:hypothetical protein NQ314_013836 [Rhamnusium bicolor]|uniref:Uncharacterized protein n=1 Tax=Rhamnusium bicolor TaxID=1586634 RepID=A0AAV8X5B6_9CUCU|nr:hypothetical protein NQ314_013836 [Rhamnusium bicolor]
MNLPKLTEIYNQYATIAGNDINFKSVLTRIFLWQLLRDIKLTHQGVSLVEADLFLADNPSSCIESNHYPFEPIYFWQFLQSLFGCSWLLLLSTKNQKYDHFTSGIISKIFKEFLEENVFPNAGKFQGSSLTEYKDLVPIQCVYELYLKIGEPHSAREFLYFTCTKKNKDPPCCAVLNEDIKPKTITDGNNAVPIGYQIIYLQVKEDQVASRIEPPTEEENIDAFSKSLYTFRKLGKKKIMQCVTKICPRIYSADGKVNMDYKLSFP